MKGILKIKVLIILILFSLTGCTSHEDKQNETGVEILQNETEVKTPQNEINNINKDIQQQNGTELDDSLQGASKTISDSNDDIAIIRWAFPTNSLDLYGEPLEKRINKKLAEDGYDFRLECVYIDSRTYNDTVENADADIVWTGLRSMDSIKSLSPAYPAIKKGKYLCLDQLLNGSKLYDLYPKMLWDTVKINEGIYCIPNTTLPDCGLALAFKKDKYKEEEIHSFDNTLEGLLKLLGKEGVLYFSRGSCDYLDMYNIPNQLVYMYFEDGKIKNLMENELNLRWIRALNNLAVNGQIDSFYDKDKWDIAMLSTGDVLDLDDEKYWKIYYKGDSGDNFKASTAIRADSANPVRAFKLLELLMTDSEYGNLALYGSDVKEENGYAINPETGRERYIFPVKMYLGINDGVLKGEMDYYSFSTPEERAAYYEKYIRMGDISWLEYPEFTGEIYYVIEKYEDMILNTKNFEEELAECIEESKAVFKLLK